MTHRAASIGNNSRERELKRFNFFSIRAFRFTNGQPDNFNEYNLIICELRVDCNDCI